MSEAVRNIVRFDHVIVQNRNRNGPSGSSSRVLMVTRDGRSVRLPIEWRREAHADYAKNPKLAVQMATEPIGPLPMGLQAPEMAAWTVVGNVLLNLDEVFAKR